MLHTIQVAHQWSFSKIGHWPRQNTILWHAVHSTVKHWQIISVDIVGCNNHGDGKTFPRRESSFLVCINNKCAFEIEANHPIDTRPRSFQWFLQVRVVMQSHHFWRYGLWHMKCIFQYQPVYSYSICSLSNTLSTMRRLHICKIMTSWYYRMVTMKFIR